MRHLKAATNIKWSEVLDPTSAPTEEPQGDPSGMGEPAMARYTIHLPLQDQDGNETTFVLQHVRQTLTSLGYQSRIVHESKGELGDFPATPMAIVTVDAGDLPETDDNIRTIAQGAKSLSGQSAIYVSKHPIESWVL